MIVEDCSKENLMLELVKLKKRNNELELQLKEKNLPNSIEMDHMECRFHKNTLLESRAQLESELEDAKLLQSISMELVSGGDIQLLYERIIAAAMQIMHSDYSTLQELHTEEGGVGRLRIIALRGFGPEDAKFWEWVDGKTACTTCAEALRRGHRIVVSNMEESDLLKGSEDLKTFLEVGIHSAQSTPLISRSGKMLGMFSTHWKKPHEPLDRELRLLDVLARQAADLIDQRQYEESLWRAEKEKRETIEAAMKLKDEFLYLISHEFKTPIAVISSALQTIEAVLKDSISERLGRYLNIIKVNTNRQLRLVNNLLDITRYNSGHIKLNNNIRDIVSITKSIVSSIEIFARQKQINLNFMSSLIKKEIYVDDEKFERIILNLLSNALKFTPNGKDVHVSLSITNHKDKEFIGVSVKDEGIGIPIDKQRVIFERFGQADTSLSRRAEGTGLGLYLVNLLIKVMGGEILLDSEPGQGSTFTVLLPIEEPGAFEEKSFCNASSQFISYDERVIQAALIEFSDIYFD